MGRAVPGGQSLLHWQLAIPTSARHDVGISDGRKVRRRVGSLSRANRASSIWVATSACFDAATPSPPLSSIAAFACRVLPAFAFWMLCAGWADSEIRSGVCTNPCILVRRALLSRSKISSLACTFMVSTLTDCTIVLRFLLSALEASRLSAIFRVRRQSLEALWADYGLS